MPRGGKRAGAGRKSALDVMETISVAAQCASRWRAISECRLAAEKENHFRKSDYHAAVARYRESGWRDETALEDIEYSRREMDGMAPDDEADAPRLVSFRVPRPYGARASVIRDVAAWATTRFGKPVSSRAVERAWKILRSVEHSEKS